MAERQRSLRIGGQQFGIFHDDDYIGGMGEEYEPGTARLYDRIIRPDHRVIDVGANIGLTAILFGLRSRHVLALEAVPSTFKLLERNVSAAGLRNVKVFNVAAGEAPGQIELAFSPDSPAGAFVASHVKNNRLRRELAKVVTLDSVAADHLDRVDFIKLDVEGYEATVLAGAGYLLQKYRPVVYLELNHFCLNVLHRTSLPDHIDRLRSIFPYLYAVSREGVVLDLTDDHSAYDVMYQQVVNGDFGDLVGGFENLSSRLS